MKRLYISVLSCLLLAGGFSPASVTYAETEETENTVAEVTETEEIPAEQEEITEEESTEETETEPAEETPKVTDESEPEEEPADVTEEETEENEKEEETPQEEEPSETEEPQPAEETPAPEETVSPEEEMPEETEEPAEEETEEELTEEEPAEESEEESEEQADGPGSYTITFHMNGGELDPEYASDDLIYRKGGYEVVKDVLTYTYSADDMTLDNQGRFYFILEELISVKKAHHSFVGWYSNKSLKGDEYDDIPDTENSFEDNTWGQTFLGPKNIHLYAKYKEEKYEVELSANGGLFPGQDASGNIIWKNLHVKWNQSAKITTNPSRTGYKLLGWSRDENSTSADYVSGKNYVFFGDKGIIRNEEENLALYAVWQPVKYTVKLNVNGGEIFGHTAKKGVVSVKYDIDSTADVQNILSYNSISKNGYYFMGWYTDKKYKNALPYDYDFAEKPKNMTLYAKWQAKDYYVSLDANGGEFHLSTSGNMPVAGYWYTFGKKAALNAVPVRSGYKFLGYAETANAAKAKYKKGTKYKTFSADAENVTLYAVWSPVKYTAKLNVSGGKIPGLKTKDGVVTVKYDMDDSTDLLKAIGTVEKTGYNFAGWYTDKKLTKEYDSADRFDVKKNTMTLYAKWEGKQYHLTLYANSPDAYFSDPSSENAVKSYFGDVSLLPLFMDGPGTSNMIVRTDMTVGKKMAITAKPQRRGYKFLGWAATPTAKKATYKSGVKYATFSKDGSDVELFAVWKKK